MLARVERAELSLDERVPYGQADLLEHAPATREDVAEGGHDRRRPRAGCAQFGGAVGFTQFVRSLGDPVTRLDRYEPTLNANDPGDPRDITWPRAMLGLMRRIL